MLPDRSKRYAGIDGEIPRLALLEYWQIAVIAILLVSLLVAIFPRRALIEKLYGQEHLDDLTLSYIENLQRTDPGNADLAILLGRAKQEKMSVAEMETLTRSILLRGDPRQRGEARLMMLAAYERAMESERTPERVAQWRAAAHETIAQARLDETPPNLAGAFAAKAFRLEFTDAALALLKRVPGSDPAKTLAQYGREALGMGRHERAAEYLLLARRQTPDRAQARLLFREGVGALMAASKFPQAMQAAERNLGDLADDPETLRYLVQTALAAGYPQRAALYAQRLVGVETKP